MNNFGFCHLTMVPVRANPSHKAEMVSQLLFGETFEITDRHAGWNLIRCSYDDYEGFIESAQFLPLSHHEWLHLQAASQFYVSNLVDQIEESANNQKTLIVAGSSLPGLENHEFSMGGKKYHFTGPATQGTSENLREKIVGTAGNFIGVPYLWGGRSPFGIDCSGFVQVVFKMNGIKLSRDAALQAQMGDNVHLTEESLPGDLAFFDNQEGNIVHVGILLKNSTIIHSSVQVRIDKIDHHGIFNTHLGKYTHQLRLIRRVLPD